MAKTEWILVCRRVKVTKKTTGKHKSKPKKKAKRKR